MEPLHRLLVGGEAPPPDGGSRPRHDRPPGADEASFDTNMVIILAALLCALVCALGLNSVVRCALRCGRRVAMEASEEAGARLGAGGLKRQALRRIPATAYRGEAGVPAPECPICLGEFADGEKMKVLPECKHGFHARCIDTWLVSRPSCPNCRHSVLERPAPEPEPADLEAGNHHPGSDSERQETAGGVAAGAG